MDAETFLAHYGVKGMRWGVRKKRDSSSGSSSKKDDYDSVTLPKPSARDAKAIRATNERKFKAKFDSPKGEGDDSRGWRPTKKQVATVAVGAGALTALYLANKHGKLPGLSGSSGGIAAGEPISPTAFLKQIEASKDATWSGGQGYLTKEALSRQGFTLKAGHEFHRLSRNVEEGFSGSTYCVSSKKDFSRYMVGLGDEIGKSNFTQITFKAKQEVKIPDTKTVLDSMREAMDADPQRIVKADADSAMSAFNNLSGTHFETSLGKRFKEIIISKGYHGIVDEMDAGVIGDTPLLMFVDNAFTDKTNIPMSSARIKNVVGELTELTQRKK